MFDQFKYKLEEHRRKVARCNDIIRAFEANLIEHSVCESFFYSLTESESFPRLMWKNSQLFYLVKPMDLNKMQPPDKHAWRLLDCDMKIKLICVPHLEKFMGNIVDSL